MNGVARGLAVGACLMAAGCGATGGSGPNLAQAPVIGRMFDGHPGFARPDAPPPPSVAHLYLEPRSTDFAEGAAAPVYAQASAEAGTASAERDVVRITLREAMAMPAPDVRFEPAGANLPPTRTLFVRLGEEGRLTRRQTSDIAVDPGERTYAAAAHDISQCWRAADEQRPDPVGTPPADLTLTDRLNAMVDIRSVKACLEALGYAGVAISEPPHPPNGPFGAAAQPRDPNGLMVAATEARPSPYADPERERPLATEQLPGLRREAAPVALAAAPAVTSARIADLGTELGRTRAPEGAPAPLIEQSPMLPQAVASASPSPATLRAEDEDEITLAAADAVESALAGGPPNDVIAPEASPPALAPLAVPVRRVSADGTVSTVGMAVPTEVVTATPSGRLPTLDALTATREGPIERRRGVVLAPMAN